MNIQKIRYVKTDCASLGKQMVQISYQADLDSETIITTGYGHMKHKALENAFHKIFFNEAKKKLTQNIRYEIIN